jgi:hypothetical protein
MTKIRQIGHVAILAAGFLATPLFAAVCPANTATPFTAGPANAVSKFADWVVDSNGAGLQICLDSAGGLGLAPPCIYSPVVPGNAFSATIGRGVEAFYYLADSKFVTPGVNAIDTTIVLSVESAFTTPEPTDGFQIMFSRARFRLDVSTVGIYKVEYPWGTKTYTVDTLLPPGNGQNRAEISDVTDVIFNAGGPAVGEVTPFLPWDPAVLPAAPVGYMGDGITLHTITGAPCGNNFVRITATDLAGVPLNIDPNNDDGDNDPSTYTNRLFTVQGKFAPASITPLSVSDAYYSRTTVGTNLSVFVNSAPGAAVTANGAAMTSDHSGRFYLTSPLVGLPPASVLVSSQDLTQPSTAVSQTAPVTDLVTIDKAEAICSIAAPKTCSLTVTASSSDAVALPALTLGLYNVPLVAGSVTLNGLLSLPASVSVSSAGLGVASKPVTITNQ